MYAIPAALLRAGQLQGDLKMTKIDKRSKEYRDACRLADRQYALSGPHVARVKAKASMDFAKTLGATKEKQVGGVHYLEMAIQPWAAMEAWMTPEQYAGFLRGNAVKYLARCDAKGGLDDIKKAHHYLAELIRFSEEKE